MKRACAPAALAGIIALAAVLSAEEAARSVIDRDGRLLRSLTLTGETSFSPDEPPLYRHADHVDLSTCAPPAGGVPAVTRTSEDDGVAVDACGRMSGARAAAAAAPAPTFAPNSTIDRMTTRGSYTGTTYTPGGTLLLLGSAETYTLSDGTSWTSGAGSHSLHSTRVEGVDVGKGLRFLLATPPSGGLLYEQTDYDAGAHSAQGTLAAAGPLVLEAAPGATTAVMSGLARIVANTATVYGEPRFNYYSAIVGSIVPFRQTYTLLDGATWQADIFTRTFRYANTGSVDFARPVSVPRAVALTIGGPGQVPDEASITFSATVRYENDVLRDVTARASWEAAPAALATVDAGVLATARLEAAQQMLTLRATYVEGEAALAATRSVLCRADFVVERRDVWPMFQGNARHTGYVPVSLDLTRATLRWQQNLARPIHPVAAGDGKVFASLRTRFDDVTSLFAFDAFTGSPLWSRNLGPVSSMNPPSAAYGVVYVQAGKGLTENDASLRAFDAATGDLLFHAPISAQWESYYAPTIVDGGVYVNGGYYGGMYGFDAFSGQQDWFNDDLPQYDEWTPAVSGDVAYAYLGSNYPGLYAVNRHSGALLYWIPDPDFEWDGWSMDLSPVVGAHDDVLVIHDGRLTSFDTAVPGIRWQIPRGFVGQPSVAADRIYAIDGARLVVLDERTGADLWSWQPSSPPRSPVIVTDTHVLVSTATHVHAVDLATQESVWSYPVAGSLALADGNLYVTAGVGALTAIAVFEQTGPMASLEITGPAQVGEGTTATYRAWVRDGAGTRAERTLLADWSVDPTRWATIGATGLLTAAELIRPAEPVIVRARYAEGERVVEAALRVEVRASVGVDDLVRRNLEGSLRIKEGILGDLRDALEMERAAWSLQRAPSSGTGLATPRPCEFAPLCLAIRLEAQARRDIRKSLELLAEALAGIGPAAAPASSESAADPARR
jgi:outer membrane protein assembly factor BamB